MAFTGAPVFARQAYEWGLVNRVVSEEELLPAAIRMAADICACAPEVLRQYQSLITEGYGMPLDEALAWEKERAMRWAEQVSAQAIEGRRQGILEKGRSDRQ